MNTINVSLNPPATALIPPVPGSLLNNDKLLAIIGANRYRRTARNVRHPESNDEKRTFLSIGPDMALDGKVIDHRNERLEVVRISGSLCLDVFHVTSVENFVSCDHFRFSDPRSILFCDSKRSH